MNKSRRQHPTKQQLYGHLTPITKTIKVRRTRHPGHCWKHRDELISDILLWSPSHGRAKPGQPARTYIQQLCEDTGCSPEDQPEAINDREEWRKRIRDIRAGGSTRWDDEIFMLQILESAPHKTAVVWPFASHLTSHTSKTNDTAGEVRMNS